MCKILIFSCISAVMLLTAAYGAPIAEEKVLLLETLIKDLKLLEKKKDSIDLRFYTPTGKQECSWQTLQCYWEEIGTLEDEIEDEYHVTLRHIRNNLQALMDLTPRRTGCKICEASNEENFPAFHQQLLNFLTSMRKRSR